MRNRENPLIILAMLIALLSGCALEVAPDYEGEPMNPIHHVQGWSTSGKLPIGLNSQFSQRAVKMQIDFTKSKNGAGLYNIQFNVRPPANMPTDVLLRTRAEVVWSVQGNSVRRDMSLFSGASISGTAESVSVTVRDRSAAVTPNLEYEVSMQVAPGTRPSQNQPPILITSGNGVANAGGGTYTHAVPQDSGVISCYMNVGPITIGAPVIDTQVVVEQLLPSGVAIARYYPLIETEFVPIYPSVSNLRVTNAAGGTNIVTTPFWGIDG